MIKWIPKILLEMEDFLSEDLKELRDYVKKTRGRDISIELHVYEERAFYLFDFEDKRPLAWKEISAYSDPSFHKKEKLYEKDERNIRKYFLRGWLEDQIWNKTLKIQNEQQVPKAIREIGLSDKTEGYFFYKEFINFSIDCFKNYWKKYRNVKDRWRSKRPRFINTKLASTVADKWYVYALQELRDFYYDKTPNITYSSESHPIPGKLFTLSFPIKTEPEHATVTNYISWQEYLQAYESDKKGKIMEKDNCLAEIKRLHGVAACDNTAISDDIKKILNRIATEKPLSELSEYEQNKILEAVEGSPKIRLALRKSQLNYIRLKKIEAYQEYIEKKERNWFVRMAECFKSLPTMIWDNRLAAAASFGVIIMCMLALFLCLPASLDTRINNLYQPVILQTTFQNESIRLPWEGITQKSVSGVLSPVAESNFEVAFSAGLWMAKQKLLQNTSATMPDFLTPESRDIKAEKWEDTEWNIDFYAGECFFFIRAVSQSDTKMSKDFWKEQDVLLKDIYEKYLKRPLNFEEGIVKYKRLKSFLKEISKISLDNENQQEIAKAFDYQIKYLSPHFK